MDIGIVALSDSCITDLLIYVQLDAVRLTLIAPYFTIIELTWVDGATTPFTVVLLARCEALGFYHHAVV